MHTVEASMNLAASGGYMFKIGIQNYTGEISDATNGAACFDVEGDKIWNNVG